MINVPLKPEHERFIQEQVKTGRFGSAEDAVAAAVARMIDDDQLGEFDPDDLRAIEAGLAQADRGEGFTLNEVKEHLRRRGIDVR